MIKFKISDPDTKSEIELELDLSNIKVEKTKDHTNKIKVSDEFTLYMRYPSIDEFVNMIKDGTQSAERNYEIMISCMEQLVSEQEVHKFKDFTKEEIDAFIDSLETTVTKEMKHTSMWSHVSLSHSQP